MTQREPVRIMRICRCSCLFLAGLALLLCACDMRFGGSYRYVPPTPLPDPNDPPSRVARLSYVEGSVSFQPAGLQGWTPAVVNRPLTIGDQLWTDAGSRAELQLGFGAIRLDARTSFAFLELTDRALQAKLTSGAIGIRIRRREDGDLFEVDTPTCLSLSRAPGNTGWTFTRRTTRPRSR
jgi:hypothetical protein